MTKLEKRQMMLMVRYEKWGLVRFTLIWGSYLGFVISAITLEPQPDGIDLPWYYCVLISFSGSYVYVYGMWFLVRWYFAKIKKRVELQSAGEAQTK